VCSIRNSEKHGRSLLCTTTVVHDEPMMDDLVNEEFLHARRGKNTSTINLNSPLSNHNILQVRLGIFMTFHLRYSLIRCN